MHAIWKGSVSFGLVSIPVKLYSATEERGVAFRQVHGEDGGRIRYKRVCSVDGQEVAYQDIAKGYETPEGGVVVLTDEDFAALPLPSRHTIEVLQFVPAEQIDGLYLAKGYYLSADGPGLKPYVLLRDSLEGSSRVALVKVALRNRESLAVLRPREGALLVQTMLWPDEVRDAAPFAPTEDVEVRDQEVAMARSYIETLSDDFDPSAFHDDYRAALEELVQAKSGGQELAAEEQPQAASTVVDLMAALRASVDAARAKREGATAAPAAAVAPAATTSARPGKAGGSTKKSAAKSEAKTPGKAAASTAARSPAKKATKAAEPTTAAGSAAKTTAKTTTKRAASAARAQPPEGTPATRRAPARKSA